MMPTDMSVQGGDQQGLTPRLRWLKRRAGPRAYRGERNVHLKEIAMRDTAAPAITRREPPGTP